MWQDLLKIWPVFVFPPIAIFIAYVAIRLFIGRPLVTPETEQERRDWQAW